MARVPSKHGRDQPLDFQGFLNDLQDWESTVKDKDKKLKSQAKKGENMVENFGKNKIPVKRVSPSDNSNTTRQSDFLKNYNSIEQLSSSLMKEESSPSAASEKDLGNDYFKQKKFKEAIECYSRSIGLSPTAVAYANRAMGYIKVKRFQEAEHDCTEALNLDDRYIKAYSRRSTVRKELGKLKESMDDAEFALRLEPQNQELKKQHAEVRALYQKALLEKASGSLKKSVQGEQNARKSKVAILENAGPIQSVSNASQKPGISTIQNDDKKEISGIKAETRTLRADKQEVTALHENVGTESKMAKNTKKPGKQLKESVLDLATRASSLVMVEAAKNITPPNTAYQFESTWRRLSGDRTLQVNLLKVTPPTALPQIFKHALSASMLIDMVRSIAILFSEEMDLAVRYLENLTSISRFDTIIMCLSSADQAELDSTWKEVFGKSVTPIEYVERLEELRPRYCLKH
ncbi:RNA polymerase II-associated protein 3 [Impatiens glandulifera]|uniref:RNA polymerase II-associated protein 3 n=1 Tax=Impatiens glandulifera TaxID=253017 RepID=UPI001FB1183F|nr:RNA polymerase II-associated protein 3 [Impatiens glandulifera]